MELALLKALLAHEFYQDHKTVVRQEIFSDEANKIKRCLDKAHDEYERDLTESELDAVFYTSHPADHRPAILLSKDVQRDAQRECDWPGHGQ